MLRNYLKIAFRSFTKDFRFSLINIIGFSLGLFSFLVIIFYVYHESNFDSFHSNSDRIYRMAWDMKSPDGSSHLSVTTAGPARDIYETFPQITAFCRFSSLQNGYFTHGRNDYEVNKFIYADSGFFKLFDYELIQGDPLSSLSEPYKVVLTESLSRKIFSDSDPVGKVLKWNNQYEFEVSGIIEDPPANSHIQYSVIASFSTLYRQEDVYLGWNGGVGYFTYFLFDENNTPEDLGQKFEDLYYDKINHIYEPAGWKIIPYFESLTDIHLYADGEGSIGRRGNPDNNRLFLIVAIIILVLACVNFMNLTTARFSERSSEIGIRKVFGASRQHIVRQFLGESLLFVTISAIIAMLLIEAAVPLIQNLSGTKIQIYTGENLPVLLSIPLIIIITGILAGSYPALFLSSFRPVVIFYQRRNPGKSSISFRNILVVFQFTVSITLIISTLIVAGQMRYMMKKNLGFDQEQMMILPMTSFEFREKQEIVQEELSKLSGVESTAATGYFPGVENTAEGYRIKGSDNSMLFNRISVDHNYIETLDLEIVKGRSFSKEFSTDSMAFIVNESFVRKMGWEEPLGKILNRDGEHPIIGVVKDFHYSSLHSPVSPLILNLIPYDGFNYLIVKFKTDNFKQLINQVQDTWKEIDPNEPFDFQFADERLKQVYETDLKFGQLFMVFALLATVLASLGLFGLSAFEAEKRKKEIGIRKILGSSVRKITRLLIGNFLKWVVIGNIIAWPIAYFFMKNWLNNFEYRSGISILAFLIAAATSIIVAVLTVWSRSYRIANLNPSDTLRCE